MYRHNNRFIIPFLFVVSTTFCCAQQKDFAELREEMVKEQIKRRGVRDQAVLDAMLKVERHKFVPETVQSRAYGDHPLPIGYNQTISQPYIVAYMTEVLDPKPEDKVLEIGTGSGYQAAILAEIVDEVYTIEIVEPLGKRSRELLKQLGYENVYVKIGDGYQGWEEHAPYDAIIVTASPSHVPEPLKQQLAEGGRMIIPVGGAHTQELVLLTKKKGKLIERDQFPVRFVPFVGKDGQKY